uniref:Uncharacterized protein n=1 Tax=Romanomermis culicivorax TaxID=13658 RepID=A0A915JHC0_ROMCU
IDKIGSHFLNSYLKAIWLSKNDLAALLSSSFLISYDFEPYNVQMTRLAVNKAALDLSREADDLRVP